MNLRNTYWIGKVVDDYDPKQSFRVKVEIPNLTQGIQKSKLPFYPVKQSNYRSYNKLGDVPPINSLVEVYFYENDIFSGVVISTVPNVPDDEA